MASFYHNESEDRRSSGLPDNIRSPMTGSGGNAESASIAKEIQHFSACGKLLHQRTAFALIAVKTAFMSVDNIHQKFAVIFMDFQQFRRIFSCEHTTYRRKFFVFANRKIAALVNTAP